MTERQAGRVVMIAGGAQGIGYGVARRFASERARLVLLDVDQQALDRAVAELSGEGVEVIGHRADVTDRAAVHAAVTDTLERWARIDALVASAGVVEIRPLLDITDASWRRIVDVNLTGTFIVVQEADRAMLPAGGGAIVVIASTNAFFVEAETAHYSATKGGLIAFVRAAALDLAPYGIRVNAINPGQIRTRLSAVLTEDPAAGPAYLKKIPLGRWGEPSDIAAAASFLVSDDASYLTGEAMTVDGGVTLGVALEVEQGELPGLTTTE